MRNIFKITTFGFLILSAFGNAGAQTVTPAAAGAVVPTAFPGSQSKDERYRIGFQDQLEIRVFGQPKLEQKVNVNSNGTINLFRLMSPVVAVCRTERELADDIAEAYKKDYLRNPEVTVTATEQRSQGYAVIGAVDKPGHYYINRRIRLLELLAQAGGPTKEAGTRILVARTGSTSNCKMNDTASADDNVALLDFKINDVMENKQDLIMQAGDIVSVLDADVVYVYGNVNKQGQVIIKEPITLTQAIVSSEGLKPATKKDRVRILRQKPGSMEREEFVYDLNAIDKRKIEDPFLQPNDIVAVSEDRTKSILLGIRSSLTQGASSIFYRFP